jgi:predicted NUDIX family phosphoesterase
MKPALVISASAVNTLVAKAGTDPEQNTGMVRTPGFFWSIPTVVADRALCETDPNSLQIIPYCVIYDTNSCKWFTYCRGKGSAEARLHGDLSIGLGGHIDSAVPVPSYHPDYPAEFCKHVQVELLRELEEEVGIDPSYFTPDVLMRTTVGEFLMYDIGRPVDKVHLALVTILSIDNPTLLTRVEQGVIEGAQWLTLEQLLEKETFTRLENWSKIIVQAAEEAEASL